jgi:hypothetical protein
VGATDAHRDPPDGPWWRRHRAWLLRGAGFVVLVLSLSWIYGLLGGGSRFPLSGVSFVAGWADCLDDGLITCTRLGFPFGVRLSLGAAVVVGIFGLQSLFGVGVVGALSILAVATIAAGSAALWRTTRLLGGSDLAGAAAALLYFLFGPVYGHSGLPVLFFGFGLVPVAVLAAVELVPGVGPGGRWRWLAAGLLLLAGLVLIFAEPYAFVLAAALVVVVAGAALVMALFRRAGRREALVALGLVVVALAIPAGIYRSVVTEESTTASPEDFYRAMGADVGVMMTPTGDTPLGDLLPLDDDPWRATEFYGDGSQLRVYLGPVMVVVGLLGAVALWRRRRSRAVALGLAAAALLAFTLALGPSLKVADRAAVPTDADGALTYDDYLMPAGEATLDLPWGFIYRFQPLASMRATYRWDVGVVLVLALLVPLGIDAGFRRRRTLAVLALALVVLDLPWSAIADLRPTAARNAEQIQHFKDDFESAFGPVLAPTERVLFLPAANDILVGWIAPALQISSYNVSFDKELARIRPMQPEEIRAAIAGYTAGTLDADAICGLFALDLVDVVVLNDFSARWNSYWWPPPAADVERYRAGAEATGVLDHEGLDVEKTDLALVVRPGPSCGGDLGST